MLIGTTSNTAGGQDPAARTRPHLYISRDPACMSRKMS